MDTIEQICRLSCMRRKAPGEQREDGNPEDIAPALATRVGAVTVFTTDQKKYTNYSTTPSLANPLNLSI